MMRVSMVSSPSSRTIRTILCLSFALIILYTHMTTYKLLKDIVAPIGSASASSTTTTTKPFVKWTDYIYTNKYLVWDAAPIVIEEYKLIFFTVPKNACSVWKLLFRRMMNITKKVRETNERHNPRRNGLKYLSDYSLPQATDMMTSTNWTRAIFVRDPKERFLSTYLEKIVNQDDYINWFPYYPHPRQWFRLGCVTYNESIQAKTQPIIFIKKIIPQCPDVHWRKQSLRIDTKFWPYINFVGNMDTLAYDAERLLRKIGAWELHGSHGWTKKKNKKNANYNCTDTNDYIFAPDQCTGRTHATNAAKKIQQYMTPELEHEIETYYASDYNNPVLNLTLKKLCTTGCRRRKYQ
jgi:Sulfotransferase family